MMEKLLIVDDNISFLRDVEMLLRTKFEVVTASSGKTCLAILESESVSAVLLDLKMPEIHGTEVLSRIRSEIDPHLPVIIITDQGEVETAVEAMQLGAYDFIPKSFDLDLLVAKIVKALERRSLEISVSALQNSQAEQYDRVVHASDAMKKVHFEIARLARIDFDVLIIGETGVGKDLTAFEIHRRSARRDRPFIPLSLRSLNESLIESELFGHEKGAFSGADRAKIGKLEAANGGTVYIPEISSLSEQIQLKLLQFMQYKTVSRVGQDPKKPEMKLNVRIIMATNEDLREVVKRGTMREDFYHRISGVWMAIPPLRERVDDIEPLAEYFIGKYFAGNVNEEYRLLPATVDALRAYSWPGNVRELENMVKYAIAFSAPGELTLDAFPHLPAAPHDSATPCPKCLTTTFPSFGSYKEAEASFKLAYLSEALRRSNNIVSKAAHLIGLTPQGFRRLLSSLKASKT
jgi:DNA-binding NtrC family response regulator